MLCAKPVKSLLTSICVSVVDVVSKFTIALAPCSTLIATYNVGKFDKLKPLISK